MALEILFPNVREEGSCPRRIEASRRQLALLIKKGGLHEDRQLRSALPLVEWTFGEGDSGLEIFLVSAAPSVSEAHRLFVRLVREGLRPGHADPLVCR